MEHTRILSVQHSSLGREQTCKMTVRTNIPNAKNRRLKSVDKDIYIGGKSITIERASGKTLDYVNVHTSRRATYLACFVGHSFPNDLSNFLADLLNSIHGPKDIKMFVFLDNF